MKELNITKLTIKPYCQVKFPINRFTLEKSISAFFKFLELPDDIKNHIDLNIAPKHRRGEVGYRLRNPSDDQYNDSKEFFHYHPSILEKYQKFLSNNPIVNDFIMQANFIWEAVYKVVYQILNEFEKFYPKALDKIFDTDTPHILLRFLKYDWSTSGKYLAKPHFDAGSFTLALAESCSGLRIGTGPNDLELIKHKEDHAIFMISSNFKKVIDSDEYSAGWHDVIQLDDKQIGQPFARWAIVAFIEAHGVEALARTETHKYAM